MKPFDLASAFLPTGLTVIEASAGTGKTWTVAHLLPKLLIEGSLPALERAVLVTFTEDAARELSERVRRTVLQCEEAVAGRRVPEPGARGAGLRLLLEVYEGLPDDVARTQARVRLKNAAEAGGEIQVSTIHAFCRQVLESEAFLCGMAPGFRLLADPAALVEGALRDHRRLRLVTDPLLSAAAAASPETWSLGGDRADWEALERLPERRLHPEPMSLEEATRRLRAALEALAAARGDLGSVVEAMEKYGANERAPAAETLEHCRKLLADLDPGCPPAELLVEVGRWKDPADWFAKRKQAAKDFRAELERGPLLPVLGEVRGALRGLRWAWSGELARGFAARLRARLAREHGATFQGLIDRLAESLSGPNGEELAARLRQRWSLCLVDESQDTDPLQLGIFERIFNPSPEGLAELSTRLVLIGDPKQAIYAFRGADLGAYLCAARKAGDQRHNLLVTYPSSHALVRGLNALWSRLPRPLGPDLEVGAASSGLDPAEGGPPDDGMGAVVLATAGMDDFPAWTRSQAQVEGAARACAAAVRGVLDRRMDGRLVGPGDCAVLVRSYREAEAVAAALRALGIPLVLRDDSDVGQSEEAGELRTILEAVLGRGRIQGLRAALATRLVGLDAEDLESLDLAAEEAWIRRFAQWREVWVREGIAALIAALDAGWDGSDGAGVHPGASRNLTAEPDAERRLTDWRHLGELVGAWEAEGARRPEALLRTLEEALARSLDGQERIPPEERQRRLEADGSAVQILTVHRAKGLEFDLVFCPFLWSQRKRGQKKRDSSERRIVELESGRRYCEPGLLDPAEAAALERRDAWNSLREHLRWAYVALTRARRRVWVLVGLVGCSDKAQSVAPVGALDWLLRPEDGEAGEDFCVAELSRKGLKDPGSRAAGLRSVLEDLERRGQGAIRVVEATQAAEPWTRPRVEGSVLRARSFTRGALPTWGLASYSSLIGGGGEAPPRERRDPAFAPMEEAPGARVPLAAFPAGPGVGNALHELLEGWDFGPLDPGIPAAALKRHGMAGPLEDGTDPAALLAGLLPAWADSRVPGLDVPLGQAARLKRLSEWPFLLGLGSRGLDPGTLAGVFESHARDGRERAYARSLAELPPGVAQGYLHGFIDRLLVHEGRWAVLDWKSNHLGPRPADYAPDSLRRAACEHHYVLQLHLYLVALRRHLRVRDPGAALAGAGLCFLRGLEAGTSRGYLWFDPPVGLLDDLDALMLPASA